MPRTSDVIGTCRASPFFDRRIVSAGSEIHVLPAETEEFGLAKTCLEQDGHPLTIGLGWQGRHEAPFFLVGQVAHSARRLAK